MFRTTRRSAARERDRVERVYSRYAGSWRKRRAWAADNPGNVAMRSELLRHVRAAAEQEIRGAGDILDIGCGNGWWLQTLREEGVSPERLFGIDSQPGRVAAAGRAVPGADVVVGDASDLGFEDGRFSLVLMFTILSSLGSRELVRGALREARRVLSPGGLLLCYEPRLPNPLNPRTRLLRDSDLAAAGLESRSEVSLTVMPWLARRLGSNTQSRYSLLSRVPPLRTHRLIAYRR
jgi:SAM-dependent methyltransferase